MIDAECGFRVHIDQAEGREFVRMGIIENPTVFYKEEWYQSNVLPQPPAPLSEDEGEAVRKLEDEYLKEQAMYKGPAPYIAYGKHKGNRKEYAWKLFLNKECR